jgi:DNA-directed RNA polymerase specialized sigma24 family protein
MVDEPGPAFDILSVAQLWRGDDLVPKILDLLDSVTPDDQRFAIVLCDVQDMDYAEIAVVMNCSLGTVKSRINRARGKLRTLLLAQSGELLPDRFRQDGGRQ